MRVLHTLVSVLIFSAVGGWAHAQTPTPHPNLLTVGLYQFEDLSSPEIELTGTDWSIRDTGYDTGLGDDDIDDTLTFWTGTDSDYLLLGVYSPNSGDSEFDICVDATCQSIAHDIMDGDLIIPIDLFSTNSEVVITKTQSNSKESVFDFVALVLDPNSIQAISGTTPGVSPTATPPPYYIFGTVTGVSGTVATRFDMVVTAGDVAITNSLLFLFFSLWAIICIVVFVRRGNV